MDDKTEERSMKGAGYPMRWTSAPAMMVPRTRERMEGSVASPDLIGEKALIAWKKSGMK